MDSRYMQEAVEIELRQYDKDYELKNKLESREIFYYLSRAERDYLQELYDEGIDKNEANKKKLGSLLSSSEIVAPDIATSTTYPNAYTITLPNDALYIINERADITVGTNNYTDVFVKPISYDEYSVNKENPFRKPTLDKCLRLDGSGTHTIITPNATLNSIIIDYVKTPLEIDLINDCELHEIVHPNIVKMAVKLILGAKQEQVGYQIQSKEEKENK